MKIAFSTIGCPDFDWPDIYAMAKDFHFDGIEIRGLGEDIFAVKAAPFTPRRLPHTIDQLKRLNLTIPCLSTSTGLKFKEKRQEILSEIREYIALAEKLSAPFIRILADHAADVTGEVDDQYIAEMLKILAEDAAGTCVTLLVETNGVYADTQRLAALLSAVNSEKVQALWDMHHPYRFFGEHPGDTIKNIGKHIRHIHVKDSVREDGKVVYKMMGEGDLPIYEMLDALHGIGYDGYISLEWVKRYMPGLVDAGIVFPHFAHYMKDYALERAKLSEAVPQKTAIWPKEQLIDLTFPELLDKVATEYPNQSAFRYTTLDYNRTYREFRDDVHDFAKALYGMGVRSGDHVAIWATNVPAWFITFWAATKLGAVLVTVNTAYKVHEAEYLLRQSDTHTLVMIDGHKDSNYIQIINEICPELKGHVKEEPLNCKRLPMLKNVITVESVNEGCFTWEDALFMGKRVPQEVIDRLSAACRNGDVCNMQYTSGTTGFPKGVMLTHYNVVNNGKAIGDCMDFSPEDKLLIHVPMFHCFGMVLAMTAAVTHAATMCPIPAFSPRLALECVNKERVTAIHGVPTMFIAMLEHPDFEKTNFSSLRTGIMAGSPCPVKVMQDVVEKMHMPEICITYGLTEASPGCTMSKTTDSIDVRVSTVGGQIFGVECKIVDPETGEDLPDDTDGEFVARGYNIMKGYYKMPEATTAVIDDEGWLHTGDLARRTKEGNYKITGRIKDMIIRGGENIYPKEIEEFLYTHPAVKDVQVIGVPDAQYGEEIMAWVILKDGETVTEGDIREYCKSRMAKHKTPRYVHFVHEFPMNAAGKILKYKMREVSVELLNLRAAEDIVTA